MIVYCLFQRHFFEGDLFMAVFKNKEDARSYIDEDGWEPNEEYEEWLILKEELL